MDDKFREIGNLYLVRGGEDLADLVAETMRGDGGPGKKPSPDLPEYGDGDGTSSVMAVEEIRMHMVSLLICQRKDLEPGYVLAAADLMTRFIFHGIEGSDGPVKLGSNGASVKLVKTDE